MNPGPFEFFRVESIVLSDEGEKGNSLDNKVLLLICYLLQEGQVKAIVVVLPVQIFEISFLVMLVNFPSFEKFLHFFVQFFLFNFLFGVFVLFSRDLLLLSFDFFLDVFQFFRSFVGTEMFFPFVASSFFQVLEEST